MKKVKIIDIAGSPRKNGNTTTLVQKALEGAASVPNVETGLYQLAGKKVHHCIACFKCLEKAKCIIEDDLQEIADKYMAADGIIWGAPVYFVSLPASMKAVINRLGNSLATHYVLQGGDIPRLCKVGGAVTGGGKGSRCDTDITGKRDLGPAPQGNTVDPSDDWLWKIFNPAGDFLPPGPVMHALQARHIRCHNRNIRTGGKCLFTGTGEHHHPDTIVFFNITQRITDLVHRF